jgi:hypothetical protein
LGDDQGDKLTMAKTEAQGRKKQRSAPRSKMNRPFLRMDALVEANGTRVEGLVLVEVQDRGYALIEEEAHKRIMDHVGRDPVSYYAKGPNVAVTPRRGSAGGKAILVAKVLVEARDGRSWKYPHFRDGNRFNLRDGNIYGGDEKQETTKRWPGGVDPKAP